jgi:hypothetical protein
MNIKDLLSNLDNIEAHTTGNPSNSLDSIDAGLVDVEVEPVESGEVIVMVPPLQASLELLKRATDIDNFYSSEEERKSCENDYEEEDELGKIQRLAGVPATVIVQSASNQTPF